jgi:hypothetical protein
MNDTPETDANCWKDGMNEWVASNLSRKLECERNEANKELHKQLVKYGALFDEAEKIRIERDEAREALEHIIEYGTEEINAAIELRQRLATTLVQRDEAREALADWENAAEHVKAAHPDEVHCGCVAVLRKLLSDALLERDEAREDLEFRRGLYSILEQHLETLLRAQARSSFANSEYIL